jgi:hypothetical protein
MTIKFVWPLAADDGLGRETRRTRSHGVWCAWVRPLNIHVLDDVGGVDTGFA